MKLLILIIHLNFDLNLFTVFRKDRCPVKTAFSRGGGVLIAVQNRFSAKALDLIYKLSNADIDQLIISINISKGCELLLFISYIPPGSSFVIYDTHFKNCSYYIDNLKPNQHIMYVGDFNLAKINWSVNLELVPFFLSSDIESLLLDFMSHNGFKQINIFIMKIQIF